MKIASVVLICVLYVALAAGLPVTKTKKEEKDESITPATPDVEVSIDNVFQILER